MATPRKSLQILSYLLLHRSQVVARDFLAFTLYPDDEEESALAKFRASFFDLQRVLPKGERWILSGENGLSWNEAAPLWLDIEAFETASRDASRFEEAVALYRGHLLEALYDDWLVSARERFCAAYLACLDELIKSARSRRAFSEGLDYAQRILHVDEWREDVVRRIVSMRYEAGDRAGALAEYRRFAERLRAEMGVEPMPETSAVADAVTREAATSGEGPLEARAPQRPSVHAYPFVGRSHESEHFMQLWARAERGYGGVVLVAGEAGIGKSRLVLELANAAETRGARVLFGATGSPESMPYQSIVEALRGARPLLAAADLPPLWTTILGTLVPELRRDVDPEVPMLEPDRERARLFEAIARALTRLSRVRPVLLVLEDLHWASEATLDAVAFVARRATGERLLIAGTYRDDETERRHPVRRFQRDMEAAGAGETVHLAGLDEPDIARLIAAASSSSAAPERAAQLLARTNGNPLFLVHLVEAANEFASWETPPTVADIVRRRLAELTPATQDAVAVAALVGRRFSAEVVREVLGWDGVALQDALDELIDRRIVRPSTGRGAFGYSFVHQVVLEAVAGAMHTERSSVHHRRIARVLEDLYPERVNELAAELARHYERATDFARAAQRYAAAAKRALALGALDDAGSYLERALALAPERRLRIELLLTREELHGRLGDTARQMRDLDELAAEAEAAGDEDVQFTVISRRLLCAARVGDDEVRVRGIGELQARIATSGNVAWQARADLAEAQWLDLAGTADDIAFYAERARAAFAKLGDEQGEARALGSLAVLESRRNRFEKAEQYIARAQQLAEKTGDYETRRLIIESSFKIAGDATGPARAAATRWLALALESGDRRTEGHAREQLATTYVFDTDPASVCEARKQFETAAGIFEELNLPSGSAGIAINASYIDMKVGAFAKAARSTQHALEHFTRFGALRGILLCKSLLAEELAFAGDLERAEALGIEALEGARTAGFELYESSALEHLATAQYLRGKLGEAVAHVTRALDLRLATGKPTAVARDLSALALFHARLGDLAQARAFIERLPSDEGDLASKFLWPQWCLWVAAQVYRAAGEPKGASEALERSRDLLVRAASGLESDERRRFLAIPWHRDIRYTVASGTWPANLR